MSGWRRQSTGGIEFLERDGASEAVVLLHGIGSNANSFARLLPLLGTDRRVIAWNAPGYGGSVPLASDWPCAEDYAQALGRLLDALEIERAVVVGHSLGGLMAAAYAATRGDRVSRLVLASPALGHGVPRGGGESVAAQSRIDDLEHLGAERFAGARAPGLIFRPETNPGLVALVQEGMSRVSLPGYAQAARMLASGRLLDDVARLSVPTDLIVGAEDRITPPAGTRRAHEALRGPARGRLTIVPEAGHALHIQAPASIAEVLGTHMEPVE